MAGAGGSSGWGLPDLLSGSRILLAPFFAGALPGAPGVALAIAMVAAATDFVDGRLARRLGGGSRRGAALDVFGDAVFVLVGLAALAWAEVLSPILPLAAALSLMALARSWRSRRGAASASSRDWPDRLGHAAGVLNYGAVLAGAGVAAFEWPVSLRRASELVAVVNLLPVALRWLRRRGSVFTGG